MNNTYMLALLSAIATGVRFGCFDEFCDEDNPPTPPNPCDMCSLTFDPVTCDDGQTYDNSQCAECAGALNCEANEACYKCRKSYDDPVTCNGTHYANQDCADCAEPECRYCQ